MVDQPLYGVDPLRLVQRCASIHSVNQSGQLYRQKAYIYYKVFPFAGMISDVEWRRVGSDDVYLQLKNTKGAPAVEVLSLSSPQNERHSGQRKEMGISIYYLNPNPNGYVFGAA